MTMLTWTSLNNCAVMKTSRTGSTRHGDVVCQYIPIFHGSDDFQILHGRRRRDSAVRFLRGALCSGFCPRAAKKGEWVMTCGFLSGEVDAADVTGVRFMSTARAVTVGCWTSAILWSRDVGIFSSADDVTRQRGEDSCELLRAVK